MEHPFISVIIPALNEEKRIGECLKAITDQSFDKNRYEIIVSLCDKTTDETARICEEYGAKIVMSPPGIGRARSDGFKAAKGDIFAGTDADTIVCPEWLSVIDENFKNSKIVSLTGPILPKKGSTRVMRLSFAFAFGFYRGIGKIQGKEYISGMNFAVERVAYEKCGGYDPNIKSSEDTDLSEKISKFGKTAFDSRMKVYTSTRRLQEGYVHSFLRYSKNYVLLKLGKRPGSFTHYR